MNEANEQHGRDDALLRADQVARALAISRRLVWKLNATGSLPAPIRIGRCTRWRAADIKRWIDAAQESGQEATEVGACPRAASELATGGRP